MTPQKTANGTERRVPLVATVGVDTNQNLNALSPFMRMRSMIADKYEGFKNSQKAKDEPLNLSTERVFRASQQTLINRVVDKLCAEAFTDCSDTFSYSIFRTGLLDKPDGPAPGPNQAGHPATDGSSDSGISEESAGGDCECPAKPSSSGSKPAAPTSSSSPAPVTVSVIKFGGEDDHSTSSSSSSNSSSSSSTKSPNGVTAKGGKKSPKASATKEKKESPAAAGQANGEAPAGSSPRRGKRKQRFPQSLAHGELTISSRLSLLMASFRLCLQQHHRQAPARQRKRGRPRPNQPRVAAAASCPHRQVSDWLYRLNRLMLLACFHRYR